MTQRTWLFRAGSGEWEGGGAEEVIQTMELDK